MTVDSDGPSVLWLTPDKPDSISVGRQRIADHLESSGFEVTLRGATRSTILRSVRERGKYDVVIGTTRFGAIGALLVSRVHGIPLVVDHVDPIRQFRETDGAWKAAMVERLENLVFRLAASVLYVYAEERDRVEQRAKVAVKTDLGVEYNRFASPDEAAIEAAGEAVGTLEDDVVVYVGGLEPIYSIESLLAAVERLDGWTLLVLGAGSLEPAVERAADRRSDVVFPGTVPHEHVPGYLSMADVGVSLVDDAHTLKVLEYGVAGLPVVQLAGRAQRRFDEMVEFCTADPDDISGAIVRAFDAGPSTELAEFAASLDWQLISEDYDTAIRRILA